MDPITIAGALKLVTTFAPDFVKFFTGSDKAANVTSAVLGVANAVTGADTPEAAATVLSADPAKVLEFQQAMLAASADLEKAQLADIQSARHMQEVALQQDDVFSKRFVYYFAAAWSLFTMFYISAITFWPPESESGKAIANTVLGFLLGTAVASIFAYFFGSTRTSDGKNKLLAMMSPK